MKLPLTFLITMFVMQLAYSQKEGTVIYTRMVQLPARRALAGNAVSQPGVRQDEFQMQYSGNTSIWRKQPSESSQEARREADRGDAIFINWDEKKSVELRKIEETGFIINDGAYNLTWERTSGEKNIQGYTCKMAKARRIYTKMAMQLIEGIPTRKEVQDTLLITAWYAEALPYQVGPDYYGGLPGVILGIDINNGKTTLTATNLSNKVDVSLIHQPKGDKVVSETEFNSEVEKAMKKKQRN